MPLSQFENILTLIPCPAVLAVKDTMSSGQRLGFVMSATISELLILICNGVQGESFAWVTVTFAKTVGAAASDWIGVFSPANFKYVQ